MMRVALTFDDGPSEWTLPIADHLEAYGARGTFFVVGSQIDGAQDVLQRLVHGGHQIGLHGWTHMDMTEMTPTDRKLELARARTAVFEACGVKAKVWRAPYMRVPAGAGEAMRLTHVGVDVDPADWMAKDPDVIVYNVQRGLEERARRGRDGAVVLLHDGIPPDGGSGTHTRRPTVDALPGILGLEGLRFVTVDELMHLATV